MKQNAKANHFEAIAAKYVPEGYSVKYHKRIAGRCDYANRLITVPRPRTPQSLYVFLHECAHARLNHFGIPNYVAEAQAETWAHAIMLQNGVPIPQRMHDGAKDYVADHKGHDEFMEKMKGARAEFLSSRRK